MNFGNVSTLFGAININFNFEKLEQIPVLLFDLTTLEKNIGTHYKLKTNYLQNKLVLKKNKKSRVRLNFCFKIELKPVHYFFYNKHSFIAKFWKSIIFCGMIIQKFYFQTG